MGERKVLNKYYPPDFDPSVIPRKKQPKNKQIKVRFMLPCSVQCTTCGEYLYKGKKFNCRKEDVIGEKYLGIQIFRFYIKCTRCSGEITLKTDPETSDYVCEFGASRNFEPWRENNKEREAAIAKREAEEAGDAMKALENRTRDSKIELDILDALDEIRTQNAEHAKMDMDTVLDLHRKKLDEDQKRLEEADEELVKAVFTQGPDHIIRRIEEDDDEEAAKDDQDAAVSDDSSHEVLRPTVLRTGASSQKRKLEEEEVDADGGEPSASGSASKLDDVDLDLDPLLSTDAAAATASSASTSSAVAARPGAPPFPALLVVKKKSKKKKTAKVESSDGTANGHRASDGGPAAGSSASGTASLLALADYGSDDSS